MFLVMFSDRPSIKTLWYIHFYCAIDMSDILDDIFKLVKTSLSESNHQQQDLDVVKDDLSLLKIGSAFLQESNLRLSADSYKQLYYLKNLQETVEDQGAWIKTLIHEIHHPCGGPGWKKVADLDMAKLSNTCPNEWIIPAYIKRTCGRNARGAACFPTSYSVAGIVPSYTRVCGRIEAYIWGGPSAFQSYVDDTSQTVTDNYVDGVVVYHNYPPTHIWTFAAGISESPALSQPDTWFCPCDRRSAASAVPSFVGINYFCESQNSNPATLGDLAQLHVDDKMWDGQNCLDTGNCCAQNRPPYFVRTLPGATSEDIVVSLCVTNIALATNIAVEVVELYVHE